MISYGNKSKIVFFGSGPVAAKSLSLLSKNFEVEAVVTKPATEKDMQNVGLACPIFSVSTRNELELLFTKEKFISQVGVLIDFGIIVSRKIIDYFPKGIINSHFSVLPEWRGADPITFVILSGQEKTGVSLMQLVEKMDEGPLITYEEIPIPKDIIEPELTDQLINLSDKLLAQHLPVYLRDGQTFSQTKTGKKTSYSRKLTKKDGEIDWTKPAVIIEREIRAYSRWPKSHTKFKELSVIVRKAKVLEANPTKLPAGSYTFEKHSLTVETGDGCLEILEVQPAGKAEMTISAFLSGYSNRL